MPEQHVEAGPQRYKSEFTMDPDNLEEELSKVPLFMSDLPSEENDTLSALQSLVFDGTPEGKRIHMDIVRIETNNIYQRLH
jgi:hypothetical protein